MTVPATSLSAYENSLATGAIYSDRLKVFKAIKQHAPCTAKELAAASGIDYYTVQRRVSEIERAGAIVRDKSRKCAISKRESMVIELASSVARISDNKKAKERY
jgi:predicted transcriptional regulator